MSGPALQAVEDGHPFVAEAIARGLRLTITMRVADGWRNYRSQMVAGTLDSGRLTIKAPLDRDNHPMPSGAMHEPWTVCFRLGHKRFSFAGTIPDECDATNTEAGTVIRWPDHLDQMRRRSFQRAGPPKGRVIAVQFWKANTPSGTRDVRYAELENLSAAGRDNQAGPQCRTRAVEPRHEPVINRAPSTGLSPPHDHEASGAVRRHSPALVGVGPSEHGPRPP